MFKRNRTKKLGTTGFSLGLAIATAFSLQGIKAEPETRGISHNLGSEQATYSILTSTQQKKHLKHRLYLNTDFARTQNRDPNFPYRATPFYSFIGWEYFPSPQVTYGGVLIYDQETDKYNRVPADYKRRLIGFMPYINYFPVDRWLLTFQAGLYHERGTLTARGNPGGLLVGSLPNRGTWTIIRPEAGGYVTWIGPDSTYTATIRAGYYYNGQRTRSTFDTRGFFYPRKNFDTSAFTLSTRLKYFPDNAYWNVFLHIQGDYRVTASGRFSTFHPDNRVQRGFFQIGPAIHYNFTESWELRALYLYTKGYSYVNENRISLRLRTVF